MYKLLLATNDQAVRDAFAAVAWEELGFRQPRLAATVQEALNCLKAYHTDAIAIALCHARSSTSLLMKLTIDS